MSCPAEWHAQAEYRLLFFGGGGPYFGGILLSWSSAVIGSPSACQSRAAGRGLWVNECQRRRTKKKTKQPHRSLSLGSEAACRNSSVLRLTYVTHTPPPIPHFLKRKRMDWEENEEHLHLNGVFSPPFLRLQFVCDDLALSWRSALIHLASCLFCAALHSSLQSAFMKDPSSPPLGPAEHLHHDSAVFSFSSSASGPVVNASKAGAVVLTPRRPAASHPTPGEQWFSHGLGIIYSCSAAPCLLLYGRSHPSCPPPPPLQCPGLSFH